jgi:hypothetical protein
MRRLTRGVRWRVEEIGTIGFDITRKKQWSKSSRSSLDLLPYLDRQNSHDWKARVLEAQQFVSYWSL